LIDVLWVPYLTRDLLFVAAIIDQDLKVCFDKKEVVITNKKNEIVAKGVRRNNIYELLATMAQAYVGTSKLWHEQFDHPSMQTLAAMRKGGTVVDLPRIFYSTKVCKACIKEKQDVQPFLRESISRVEAPLQLVPVDLS